MTLKAKPKSKILLVDDRQENLDALAALIKSDDVETHCANSGDAALEYLLTNRPTLALIDVQMPGMTGFELAATIRSSHKTKDLPIIFVTASESAQHHIFTGYQLGAVDYITKPVNPHIVRQKVRVFVELDQKTKALEEKSAALQHKSEVLQQKITEIENLKIRAEAANDAKSAFLANVSHEIRTPLGAMLGFVELLALEAKNGTPGETTINGIRRNGVQLQSLIDSILDLSKIEADRIDIEPARVSLAGILADLRSMHSLKASESGIDFQIITEGSLPEFVTVDETRLKQVLNNILGNAMKFAAHGQVELRVRLDQGADGRSKLNLAVTDNGIGISDEQAAQLFQPFVQADGSITRKFGGTGLGLTISRQLARLMGGDVRLVSFGTGKPTTFEIEIDSGEISDLKNDLLGSYAAEGQKPRDAAGSLGGRPLRGVKILVVDDFEDNRTLMRRLLDYAGAEVELCADGLSSIEKAAGREFDVIFMDVQMPGMDGLQATRKLRETGYDRNIVALTAHSLKEELDRCLAAGCDDFMCKPVDFPQLVSKVRSIMQAAR